MEPKKTAPDQEAHGIDVVAQFLEERHATYELMSHADTFAASTEAEVVRDAPGRMAKTVVLHDHIGFCTAVIPASAHVDLAKARKLFGASGRIRLATEEEIGREFPAFDPGALPPFSALFRRRRSSIAVSWSTTTFCAAVATTGTR